MAPQRSLELAGSEFALISSVVVQLGSLSQVSRISGKKDFLQGLHVFYLISALFSPKSASETFTRLLWSLLSQSELQLASAMAQLARLCISRMKCPSTCLPPLLYGAPMAVGKHNA